MKTMVLHVGKKKGNVRVVQRHEGKKRLKKLNRFAALRAASVTKMVIPPHVRVRRVVPRCQSSYSLTRDAGLAFYDTCHYYIRYIHGC